MLESRTVEMDVGDCTSVSQPLAVSSEYSGWNATFAEDIFLTCISTWQKTWSSTPQKLT